MNSCKSIYDPQEDSSILERWVRQYAKGKVLDIGTGSGVQAIAAAQNPKVKSVLATDVQKGVIDYCKKNIRNPKIKFLLSDLFSNVKGRFDAIIFNPPYLPQDLKIKDLTLEGGKKGYEIIQKFINEVNEFLSKDGIILIVFSSLTKKEKVEEFIKNNLLDFVELEKKHIFFEDIYAYLLKKNEFLRKLETANMQNVKYLAKGHRGLLFTGEYKNKKIAIKTKNPQSKAAGKIANESGWLKRLNKSGIGPGLIDANDDYFTYEYIDGDFILDYFKKSNKRQIKKIIKDVFGQLHEMDKLKIDKEEMHHPLKHVIISGNNPFLIDFERAHYSNKPKNVTQFCQFIAGGHLSRIFDSKKIFIDRLKLMELAKLYKNNPTTKNFKILLKFLVK